MAVDLCGVQSLGIWGWCHGVHSVRVGTRAARFQFDGEILLRRDPGLNESYLFMHNIQSVAVGRQERVWPDNTLLPRYKSPDDSRDLLAYWPEKAT